MSFYEELQMNALGSKMLIRNSRDTQEKRRHIAIYIFKVILTLGFCVAFVSGFTALFGQENSVAGVSVLLFIMVFRQADLGMKVKDSAAALLFIFLVLIVGPKLANIFPVFPAFIVNSISVFIMVFLACHNLLMFNHATLLIAYFLLWGNDVSGSAFIMRAIGLAVGGLLTTAVFCHTHYKRTYKREISDLFREFHFHSVRGSWQVRISIGVSFGVLMAQLIHLPRPMWVAFVVMSVLQPMPADTPRRIKLRIPGTILGGILFFALCIFIPESCKGLLGLVGGLCVGFCSNYGWQTVFNAFGALYSAIGVYGPLQAVIIRYAANIFGAAYIFFFDKIMYRLLTGRQEKELC